MATIDIGKLTFTHKGDYASGTAYVANDVVQYNGNGYIAKQSTQGNVPTNATYWNVFVSKGTDGTDADLASISGTVQGDVYYNNGSAIARLAAGTNGHFLKTQGSGANPTWAEAGGGILLAFNAEEDYASTTGTNNTSFVDVGSDIQITPTQTSDKVWVNVFFQGSMGGGNGTYKLVRDIGGTTTDLLSWTIGASQTRTYSKWYQDSPSTTSAITYKLFMKSDQGNQGHFVYIGFTGFVAWQTLVTAN